MPSILVVEDDKDLCLVLSRFLSKNSYVVHTANTGEEGLNLIRNNSYDLILCDLKVPDTDGVELLQKMFILDSSVPVIVMTGNSDVKSAVDAFRVGAVDYVVKPLFPDELLTNVEKFISGGKLTRRGNQDHFPEPGKVHTHPPNGMSTAGFVVGKSAQSLAVQRDIEIVSPSDMSVIIVGETGTGKEFVAQSIHKFSKRSKAAFMAIDCGALPKDLAGSELFGHVKGAFTGAISDKRGSFELADGGTIFLDEIGNLSYENQVKLLRVIQERKIKRIGATRDIAINVRIITATNENLIKAVKEGKLREDLYHRLNEFKIELAPLRERKEDIEYFSDFFLQKANQSLEKMVKSFSVDARRYLSNYHWHGNLRELNNAIRRAVLLSSRDVIEAESLPAELREVALMPDLGDLVQDNVGLLKSIAWTAERHAIMEVLEKVNYNKSKASEVLTIDRKTLYNKLKLYSIKT